MAAGEERVRFDIPTEMPLCIFRDDVLDAENFETLRAHANQLFERAKASTVFNIGDKKLEIDSSVRSSKTETTSDPAMLALVDHLLISSFAKQTGFRMTRARTYVTFQFYGENDFFDWHKDYERIKWKNNTAVEMHFGFCLESPEEGGEFETEKCLVEMARNRAWLFDKSMKHRARKVTKGIKIAMFVDVHVAVRDVSRADGIVEEIEGEGFDIVSFSDIELADAVLTKLGPKNWYALAYCAGDERNFYVCRAHKANLIYTPETPSFLDRERRIHREEFDEDDYVQWEPREFLDYEHFIDEMADGADEPSKGKYMDLVIDEEVIERWCRRGAKYPLVKMPCRPLSINHDAPRPKLPFLSRVEKAYCTGYERAANVTKHFATTHCNEPTFSEVTVTTTFILMRVPK
jgi:predicted 2-oxoglutarate/Fe(II)-dependent dioxygenase YbiX